jgi:hypothetical protein
MSDTWFSVSKNGLAKLVERRGKVFILHELLQNAWDCVDATEVHLDITPIEGRPMVKLVVRDNSPEGFKDLTHAYTLFAESEKKTDTKRRGRFNLGEKLVLALCEEAEIESTKGTVSFTKTGRQERKRKSSKAGTEFRAIVRMTREELDEVLRDIENILPNEGTKTFINGEEISPRTPITTLTSIFLQTEVADSAGYLRRKYENTSVSVYRKRPGEVATLYEMGIPVMEMGDDPFHVNVGQKIPLTMERDAVHPRYLREVRGTVLDKMHAHMSALDFRGKWSADAIEESENKDAVRALVTARFGEKVVIADPSDHEGENIAKAKGYTVIPGGSFTSDAWDKIREAEAALPAGQVTPSPKPFSPDGEPLKLIPKEQWSEAMKSFANFAVSFSRQVARLGIYIEFTNDRGWKFDAAYRKTGVTEGRIIFNVGLLGMRFFTDRHHQYQLLFHELGHHWGQHLDSSYHEALTRMGAEALRLSVIDPDFRAEIA